MSLRRSIVYLPLKVAPVAQPACRVHLSTLLSPLRPWSQIPSKSAVVPFLAQRRSPQYRELSASCVFHENVSSGGGSKPDASEPSPSHIYTYEDIHKLTQSPDSNRILIDVREPSELSQTGRIPTARNIPLQSSADFAKISPIEFEERFGFARPTDKQEVIFYCKSGVRSRTAAQLAKQGRFAGEVGEFPGSWAEWSGEGGHAERS